MNPKKVKDVRSLAGAIEDWECKVKTLGNEHDITVDDKIKNAVLTSMCPEEVQNLIFQWADDKSRFEDIRDKVVALAQNRSAEARPRPMEVDQVKWEEWYPDYKEYEAGWNEERANEVEIDYVGETCRKCGGLGHYARECPTPKGKGKGGKDAGKGAYKGYKGYGKDGGHKGYKGYGRNDYHKGKGKGDFGGRGFAGPCWVCGEVGHRAVSCPKKSGGGGGAGSNMEIGAVAEEAEASVGGVWAIAAVEAEAWKVVGKGGKLKIVEPKISGACAVQQNRFQSLVEDGGGKSEQNEGMQQCANELKERIMREIADEVVPKKLKVKEPVSICAVPCCPPGLGEGVGKSWRKIGQGEITIDSAAEESVCPKGWCMQFGAKEPDKFLKFVNASGGQMGHYGERKANFKVPGNAAVMSLNFQVSDVQKPLAAVRRIAERGNIVQFGPKDEDNFIKNEKSGMKIMMVRRGGSYVIPADMIMEVEGFPRQAS
jgi:hypothetical protein